MGYLSRLKSRGFVPKVMHQAIEIGTFAAASYGFGYVQSRYREKAAIKGVPADLATGVALKIIGLGCDILGKGKSLQPHMNNVANAGIAAYFHTMGSGKGAKASGITRLLVQSGDVDKVKKVLPNATVMGAISPAPHGDFLSAKDLASLARG